MSIQHRQLNFPPNSMFPILWNFSSYRVSASPSTIVEVLSSLLVPYSSSRDSRHRIVQYAPHYRLAFSLLNEDAAAGDTVKDWNIQAELRSTFCDAPFVPHLMLLRLHQSNNPPSRSLAQLHRRKSSPISRTIGVSPSSTRQLLGHHTR